MTMPASPLPNTAVEDVWGNILNEAIRTRTTPEYIEENLPERLTPTALSATIASSMAPAAAAVPSGYRTILMGDSITAGSGGISTATPRQPLAADYSSLGMHRWANVMLGHRLDIIGNSGIGGNETDTMLARFETDVLDYNPDIVSILAGTNDDVGDSTISNLEAMYRLALNAGITVLAHTVPPTVNAPTGLPAFRQTVNDWIRAFVAKTPGMILADIGPTWQATGTTDYVADGKFLPDGMHPNTLGAQVAGRVIADALNLALPTPLKATPTNIAPRNVLTNPRFTGTGTTPPTGWTFGGNGTISYLPNSEGPGQQLVLTVPAGGTTVITSNIEVGKDLLVGDVFDFTLDFQCWDLEAAAASQRATAFTHQYNGSAFSQKISDVYVDGGTNYGNARYPLAKGTFRTPPKTVASGMTLVQVALNFHGGGTYVLAAPRVRNLTGITENRAPWVAAPAEPAPAPTNLLTNGGFETDTTGWVATNSAVISRDTAEKSSGTASLKLVHSTASLSSTKTVTHAAIAPSKLTTATAKIKAPAGHQFQLVMHLYTATGWSSSQQSLAVTATGGWDTVSRSLTVGADITRAILEVVKASGSSAEAPTIYVDDVVLSQGS